MSDYTTSFVVDRTPDQVFADINDVRGWWTGEIAGCTDTLGAEFTYQYEDLHRSTQRITELVPGEKVVWLVTDAVLSFTKDPAEWNGTEIVFELRDVSGGRSEVSFTHRGLGPQLECFDDCSGAWNHYISGSLRDFISSAARQASH